MLNRIVSLLTVVLACSCLKANPSVITIELTDTDPGNFIVRSSFLGLLNNSANFGFEAVLSETADSLTYTLSHDGEYDPRLVETLQANINSIFYPYTPQTTLSVSGTPFEGERLFFEQLDLSSVTPATGFNDVAFGAGRFLTIPLTQSTTGSVEYIHSTNGTDWTLATIPGYHLPGPAYFLNDRFMIPALNPTTFESVVLYSLDGLSWDASIVPTTPQTMAYGKGKWIGINGSSGTYMVSTDGEAFTGSTILPVLGGVNRMVFANDLFVAVGGGFHPSGLWTSEDGESWAAADPFSLPGRVTAPGAYITGAKGVFFNYMPGQNPADGQTLVVDYENGLFFNTFGNIFYSPGITGFIQADVEPALGFNAPNSVAYGNGTYVFTGIFTGIHVADELGGGTVQPISPWSGVEPVSAAGDKVTGIGLINDSAYPHVWHHEAGAWLICNESSTTESVYGYNATEGYWFWTSDLLGGWFLNLDNPQAGSGGWDFWD